MRRDIFTEMQIAFIGHVNRYTIKIYVHWILFPKLFYEHEKFFLSAGYLFLLKWFRFWFKEIKMCTPTIKRYIFRVLFNCRMYSSGPTTYRKLGQWAEFHGNIPQFSNFCCSVGHNKESDWKWINLINYRIIMLF